MCNYVEKTESQKEAALKAASTLLRLAMHKADFIVADMVGSDDRAGRNRVEFMQMFKSVVNDQPYVPVAEADVPRSNVYKSEYEFWHAVGLGLQCNGNFS